MLNWSTDWELQRSNHSYSRVQLAEPEIVEVVTEMQRRQDSKGGNHRTGGFYQLQVDDDD